MGCACWPRGGAPEPWSVVSFVMAGSHPF
jgi:hypothetical protein